MNKSVSVFLKNKAIRFIYALLLSIILSILIFIILSYTGITLKVINWLMVKFGYDFWQGEDRSVYVFNFTGGIFVLIYIITLVIVFRFLSKISSNNNLTEKH